MNCGNEVKDARESRMWNGGQGTGWGGQRGRSNRKKRERGHEACRWRRLEALWSLCCAIISPAGF